MSNSNEKITHDFQNKYSLEERKIESANIMKRYPNRIPVIVESDSFILDKKKFLVPNGTSISQFLYIIRKRLKIAPESAIFLFFNNNTLLASTTLMSQAYKEHKHMDSFIYCKVTSESTFGDRFI